MVRHHPDIMFQVLDDRVDTRPEETIRHIDKFLELRLLVIDDDADVRAVPDQSTAILNDVVGRTDIRGHVRILRNHLVDKFPVHRVHQ